MSRRSIDGRCAPLGQAIALLCLSACGGASTRPATPPSSTSESTDFSKGSDAKASSSAEKKKKPGWMGVDAAGKTKIAAFADDYLTYVQTARTTRQSTQVLRALAEEAGGITWDNAETPRAGDLLIWQDPTNGSIAFLRVGTAPVAEGLTILLASHDSALIRLTPKPIYERSGLALFDTSILGTLDLESWLHTPLALSLYQVPASPGGRATEFILGDDSSEPVFTIPDLLPHLSRKVQKKKLIDSPERLDVVAGFTEKAIRATMKRAGIAGDSLAGIEATLVPAGAPSYIGTDRALLAGANHASRAAPFAAVRAVLTSTSSKSTLLILMGRDKQFYAGAGPEGHVANLLPKAVETLSPKADALTLRRIIAKSRVLMFDHTGGDRNRGVVLGTRRDDSSPSALRHVMRLFEEAEVATQLLQTSGWSEAREVASLDIDTVALGLPVTGVGRPYELLSTYDLYQSLQACLAWVQQ